jgi:hypothetical protein
VAIVISAPIVEKLKTKHNVTSAEVNQCFANKIGTYVSDDREEHQTDPPTLWFVAPTNCGRLLKVIFVFRDGNVHVKSAYEPSAPVIALYEQLGK